MKRIKDRKKWGEQCRYEGQIKGMGMEHERNEGMGYKYERNKGKEDKGEDTKEIISRWVSTGLLHEYININMSVIDIRRLKIDV